MDTERYYDKKPDGAYVVHFGNNNGLTVSQVNEIFSAFGKVLSVDNRGQDRGLCFVRYNTPEECVRCVNGLQNHESIKILPHKNKPKQVKKKTNDNYDYINANRNKRNIENSFKDNTSENSYSSLSQCTDNDRRDYPVSGLAGSDSRRSKNFSKNCTREDNNLSGQNNSKIGNAMALRLSKIKHLQNISSNSSISSETSVRSFRTANNVVDNNEIPALIYNKQNITENVTEKVVLAQEIIVANIHPKFGIHYILHLVEKYNPLTVSLMKTVPLTGLRYCHIYFETLQEALATENEFDGYSLHGNSLIVLTSQKLSEEALAI